MAKICHHMELFSLPCLILFFPLDKNAPLEETLSGDDAGSPFCLLLKRKAGIRVGPKSTLDIPVCFAPTEMKMFESICTVIVTREDGEKWNYVPRDTNG